MSTPTDRAEPVAPIPPAGPEPLSADQLRAWVARRERSRSRVKVAIAAGLAVGAVGLGLVVSAFHDQFFTMGRLKAVGFAVDWDLDLANLRRGGVTAVAARPTYWRNGQDTTDVDLRSIARLRHVISLDLSNLERDLRDDDLAFLAGLTDLADLQLNRNPDIRYRPAKPRLLLTDGVLDHIVGLTQLKSLGLSDNRITDAGLVKLARLTHLENLDLDGTRVTDRGLLALGGMTKLRLLRVEDTKVTREGVAALQKLLPELEIAREKIKIE